MNPTPGQIVLYRLPYGPFAGEQRPAVVMRADATLGLRVFTTPNDGIRYGKEGVFWVEGVSPGMGPGEWIWPPRAG